MPANPLFWADADVTAATSMVAAIKTFLIIRDASSVLIGAGMSPHRIQLVSIRIFSVAEMPSALSVIPLFHVRFLSLHIIADVEIRRNGTLRRWAFRGPFVHLALECRKVGVDKVFDLVLSLGVA